jgi:hypothetical protein
MSSFPKFENIGSDWIPPVNTDMINKSSIAITKFRGLSQLPQDAKNSFSWSNNDDIRKYNKDVPLNFLSKPMMQGNCGDCWAISIAQCFSDRWAIVSKTVSPNLSSTMLLSCSNLGCSGGNIALGINILATIGISSSKCWDYKWCSTNENCTNVNKRNIMLDATIPNCGLYKNKCISCDYKKEDVNKCSVVVSEESNLYKCKDWPDVIVTEGSYPSCKTFSLTNGKSRTDVINEIKEEIFLRGPVVSCFRLVPDHFRNTFNWVDGIYVFKENMNYCDPNNILELDTRTFGGHSIVIVGWGQQRVTNKTLGLNNVLLDYWILRNTWGEKNDLNHTNGYFKMAISNCELKINVSMGLDVPINVVKKFGEGEYAIKTNELFGGVTAMLADLSSVTTNTNKEVHKDDDTNNKVTTKVDDNKFKYLPKVGGVIIIIVIVIIIIKMINSK